MVITVTEFKQNPDKYLLLAETENVLITRDGKAIAMLSNPNADRIEMANSLLGFLLANACICLPFWL